MHVVRKSSNGEFLVKFGSGIYGSEEISLTYGTFPGLFRLYHQTTC
jgi:hypothetical protein